MSIYTKFIIALAALVVPVAASAQMTLEADTSKSANKTSFADSIRLQRLTHNYYSEALHRHQRKLVRQERNTVEINAGLQGSLTNLSDSWIETSGGDNSVTLLTSFTAKHTYKKSTFSVETLFSAKFGYYYVVLEDEDASGATVRDPVWYKNQDEIQFSVTPSVQITKNWSYGASVKFRSQLAKGYVSSSSQEDYNLKSDFMSPGYLDISGGLIYKSPKEKYPFTLSFSPIALSAIYVTSAEVKENAQYSYADHESTTKDYVEAYGVSPYTSSKYEGGFSLQLDYDKYFGKKKIIRYVTTVYSFYGWMSQLAAKNMYKNTTEYEAALAEWNTTEEGITPTLAIHPTVRWENKVEIKATKLLSTTLNFQLYYNRAQNYKIQTQTLLSVGLAYKFTN